jgi:hypothetical protein
MLNKGSGSGSGSGSLLFVKDLKEFKKKKVQYFIIFNDLPPIWETYFFIELKNVQVGVR